MDTTPKSKKPMTRDEVLYFVELIQNCPIITSKETNATSNKMKDEAWVSLAAAFNAKCGGFPKQKEQLKLKWDNLKKAARKRTQQIRMNRLKTGGGKGDYIPADETLDKVASLMGSTCTGFEVPFGGDGYGGGGGVLVELDVGTDIEIEQIGENRATVQMPTEDLLPHTNEVKKRKLNFLTPEEGVVEGNNSGGKFLYGMPIMSKSLQNKAKKKKIEDGRLEKNLAIAEYFKKKTEKLDLEIRLLKLANKEKLNDI